MTRIPRLEEHARHEAEVMHPLFKPALPDLVARLTASHDALDKSAARVEGLVDELRAAPPEPIALGSRLYLAFNELVGQQLLHLDEEEKGLTEIWRAVPEAELLKIPAGVQKLVTPEAHQKALKGMLPALTPAERAGMFKIFRGSLPEDRYRNLCAMAREILAPGAWEKLQATLPA